MNRLHRAAGATVPSMDPNLSSAENPPCQCKQLVLDAAMTVTSRLSGLESWEKTGISRYRLLGGSRCRRVPLLQ